MRYWYKFFSLAVRKRDRGFEKLNLVEPYSFKMDQISISFNERRLLARFFNHIAGDNDLLDLGGAFV